jgi:hypothetical protein
MTAEQKAWIDGADYERLLETWRFGSSSNPYFQGDTGEYFKKRDALSPNQQVAASKNVGWNKR